MTRMAFLPELRDFLRDKGEIYTVRKYRMMHADVEIEGLGTYRRTYLGRVFNRGQLEPYVLLSGFTTSQRWWAMIQKLSHGSSNLYLYHITKKPNGK